MKAILRKVSRLIGLEITTNRNLRISLYQAIRHLKRLGFNPTIIVDAGVASGTPAIYENYPKTKTILIEPLKEYKDNIGTILKKHPVFIYLQKAISDKSGTIEFYSKEAKSGSSEYLADDESTAKKIEVDSITLEQVVEQFKISAPALLKLDIEGSERKVLLANLVAASKFDVIICEVTFIPRLINAPAFSDLYSVFANLNYCIFDIVGLRYNKENKNLFQADVVFIKEDSILRGL